MAMLIKLAGEAGISLPEILFWRQFLTVPLVLGFLALTGGLARLKTQKLGSHAKRSVIGMVGMVCNFIGLLLLPLAEATTLGFTTPLFVVIIAGLLFREHIGPWRLTAVALGFAGVIVIAQPGSAPISALGAAATLSSALTTAIVSFLIRDMSRTEEPMRIVFYFALVGSIMLLPLLPFYMAPHSGWHWLLMMAIGLFGMSGQLFVTASLRHGAIASVVVMDYTSLIWATGFGWLVWDHLPPMTTWLGAPLIVAAGLVIAWREHRLNHQPSPLNAIQLD